MQTENIQTTKISAIDRALAAAKARKAALGDASQSAVAKTEVTSAEIPSRQKSKPKAEKPTDADREAARAARDAARVERLNAKAAKLAAEAETKAAAKVAREAAKAEKRAAKEAEKATKKPAHMKKVERARAKCPPLSDAAQLIFSEITANLSAGQIDALAQHLLVHNRATATILATRSPALPLGATVRITGGEAKWIGAMGTVVHSQKLRAKVEVSGVSKPVYIYNGQADVVQTAQSASSA
jgi:hypothetical protein